MNIQRINSSSRSSKGFTLVELIVVITILAILGTIAFISLQGQAGAARDTKRKSDLSEILKKGSILQAQGVIATSLVSSGAGAAVASVSLAGKTPSATEYIAGTPNFSALGINGADFMDGANNYKMGVTSLAGSALQIAATLENDSSGNPAPNALVMGTYKSRGTTAGDINTATGVATAPTSTTLTVALNQSDIGKFKKNDTIAAIVVGTPAEQTAGCTGTATVTSVSTDLSTLAISCATLATAGNISPANLKLAAAESAGLIGSSKGAAAPGTAVSNGSGSTLPY